MILAGGMSTRLYPLTRRVPKPLVPVAGVPITAHVMRYLRSFGIEEIAINVHYLADDIEAYFGDGSKFGVRLTYLHEAELMGSAGALKQMEPFFRDEPFVVVGCDDLTDLDLDKLTRFHKEKHALASIALYEAQEVEQYGVVILNDAGRIIEFQEKPPKGTERSHLVNTGVYAFDPAIFEHIPADEFVDFGKNVFPALQQANAEFYGLLMPGAYWCDVGTPSEYRRATDDVLAGRVRVVGERARGLPPSAILGDDVMIEGDVRVGDGTELGAGVRVVGPSVVGDGVVVGDGAHLERAIVWNGARIGPGATVRDAIVGIGYEVPAGTTLAGDIVAPGEPVAN